MKSFLLEKVSLLTIIFLAICGIDLVSTSIVLMLGASEANPLMNFALKQGGIGLLTFVKLLVTVFVIILLELAKTKEMISQKMYRNYYLVAIILYLWVYGFFFIMANF